MLLQARRYYEVEAPTRASISSYFLLRTTLVRPSPKMRAYVFIYIQYTPIKMLTQGICKAFFTYFENKEV